jgi:hypothetical protein
MKNLTADERFQLAGVYSAPKGLYEYAKSLPFTGRVKSDVTSLVAGEWTEIALDYEVGASGLADGAWIKGTFKFYSVSRYYRTGKVPNKKARAKKRLGLGIVPDIRSHKRQLCQC